jgi:hypothetical protein
MQQSHLCPLPLAAQPVHWAFDHALQLYPLPHALVLADGSAAQEELRHEGCVAFNPVRRVFVEGDREGGASGGKARDTQQLFALAFKTSYPDFSRDT